MPRQHDIGSWSRITATLRMKMIVPRPMANVFITLRKTKKLRKGHPKPPAATKPQFIIPWPDWWEVMPEPEGS